MAASTSISVQSGCYEQTLYCLLRLLHYFRSLLPISPLSLPILTAPNQQQQWGIVEFSPPSAEEGVSLVLPLFLRQNNQPLCLPCQLFLLFSFRHLSFTEIPVVSFLR